MRDTHTTQHTNTHPHTLTRTYTRPQHSSSPSRGPANGNWKWTVTKTQCGHTAEHRENWRILRAITQSRWQKPVQSVWRILKINKQSTDAAELWPQNGQQQQRTANRTATAKGEKHNETDDDYDAGGAQRSATDEAHLETTTATEKNEKKTTSSR